MADLGTVNEGATALYSATLKDETGTLINGPALDALTLTVYDVLTREIVNSRNYQDVLNKNNVTISATGDLQWTLTPADNVMITDPLPFGTKFVSASNGGAYVPATGKVVAKAFDEKIPHATPTAAFVGDPNWQFPAGGCEAALQAAVGDDHLGLVDAEQVAVQMADWVKLVATEPWMFLLMFNVCQGALPWNCVNSSGRAPMKALMLWISSPTIQTDLRSAPSVMCSLM